MSIEYVFKESRDLFFLSLERNFSRDKPRERVKSTFSCPVTTIEKIFY